MDGQASYDRALDDIRRAQRFVWLEVYTLERDEVGREFAVALADAARRGCDVRLLFDRFGSPAIGPEQARPIVEAGGIVAVYNPLVRRRVGRKVSTFLHRDHRKMLLVDGVGYTGGRNIGLDYGSNGGPTQFFDITVRIAGPAVRDMASVFVDAFHDATGREAQLPEAPVPDDEGIVVDVLELNNEKSHHDLDKTLRSSIRAARSSLLLATPYFVPPKWFLRELFDAERRGVDVRLFTAGRSDVPFIQVAGQHLYGRLLRRGIRIFEMQNPTFHAKCLVIDGAYSIVGSYNIDVYGGSYNLEVGVALHGEEPARHLTEILMDALDQCREIHLEHYLSRGKLERFAQWAAFSIARIA